MTIQKISPSQISISKMRKSIKGDTQSFDDNWRSRPETSYNHWTCSRPVNQVQLAFRHHWLTFSRLLLERGISHGKCLEVGCGRGSLGAYFSQYGWNTTLLDISEPVIVSAKKAFARNGLKANFVLGDCLNMPFDSNSFDTIYSIGLFEHFEDVVPIVQEQYRLLRPEGICFAYVVPHKQILVQDGFNWFNSILFNEVESSDTKLSKAPVFRSSYNSDYYKTIFEDVGFVNIQSSGIYSMPMISSSPEFPFTLLRPESELILVDYLNSHLNIRRAQTKDPWLCPENYGHAFLVWASK